MTVSVVVATKNRHHLLGPLIDNLVAQSAPLLEIILVDQTEQMMDREALEAAIPEGLPTSLVFVHDPTLSGLPAARNRGVRSSRGELVLFLDDDITLDKDYVAELIRTYEAHPEVGGVSGVQIQEQSRSAIGVRLFSLFRHGPFSDQRRFVNRNWARLTEPVLNVSVLSGGLTSYRREVFEHFWFDENLHAYALGEDFDFSYRCSKRYALAINPRAKAVHAKVDISRLTLAELSREKVLSKLYFYEKNVEKTASNRACLAALQCGLLLESIMWSFRRRTYLPFGHTLLGYVYYFTSGFEKSKVVGCGSGTKPKTAAGNA